MKAEAFVKTFKPYRGKYAMKSKTFFGEHWFSREAFLSGSIIENAISGALVAGWYLTANSDVFGVDIDDHKQEFSQFSKLNGIVEKLGVRPSVLFKSPRGLHAYWFLTERLPVELIKRLGAERLPGVEIRPTDNQSLRIPAENAALDPETFQPLLDSFENICEKAERVHPAFLFGEDYLPEKVRSSLQARKMQARVIRAIPRLQKVEAECLPFFDGKTNEKYLKLVTAYKFAGLTVEEAVYRFGLVLEQSRYTYSGDLRNPRILESRVRSSYKNIRYTPRPRLIQAELFTEMMVEALVELSPFHKKRTWPIRRFLYDLLRWKAWHDEIAKHPGQVAFMDFIYPYYRKNRRAGFYPLPRNLFRKLNTHFETLVAWLVEIRFLKPSPYGYSSTLGICKYYALDTTRFISGNNSVV